MADTAEEMRPHGRGESRGAPRMRRQENSLWGRKSDVGMRGKYERVKGGKTAERSRGYGVLWKIRKR